MTPAATTRPAVTPVTLPARPATAPPTNPVAAVQRGNRWLLLALLLLAFNLWGYVALWQTTGPSPLRQVGQVVPDFELTDLRGQTVRLSALRQPVSINFFSTQSEYSRAEMPVLVDWAAQHPEVRWLLLADETDPLVVEQFVTEFDLPFTVLLDPTHQIWRAYEITRTPQSFFVDADRRLHSWRVGGPLTGAHLDTHLVQLLRQFTPLPMP